MIRKGKKTEKKITMPNINILFNGRNDAVKVVENYGSMILEVKRKATEGKGLKILTPKQMLQRLPIALTQVKTGNDPASLLNEIK